MAVNSSIIVYNDGFLALATVFKSLRIPSGHYFAIGAKNKNTQRIKNMERKSLTVVKKRRKIMRSINKGFIDKTRENEGGDACNTGNF